MRVDRRGVLSLIGLAAAAPAAAQSPDKAGRFLHGVASGDPQADRVIIWTRLTTDGNVSQAVGWEMAMDRDFTAVAAKGTAVAGPDRDFTVKADVTGLKPGTDYFYRFRAQGAVSPIGRTRTLPAAGVRDVVLAVASCALYPQGYFNAYQAIAEEPRLDAVLHLGDYIYEYGGPGSYGMGSAVAGERPHDPPHEIVSLADYRRRHAQYKSDPQLQAAHARAPWIVVWDDHESANDSFLDGAQNHEPPEGDWAVRKAAALRAYFEWMPIREPASGQGMAEAAMRSFDFGDLAALIMVETRLSGRTQQLTLERDLGPGRGPQEVAAFKAKLNDPNRRMMSAAQETWLATELSRSVKAGHTWQVLGNQVLMTRVESPDLKAALTPEQYAAVPQGFRGWIDQMAADARLGLPRALDMWEGYPADRERVYDLARAAGARPIVVAGDSHAFWANELHDAAGRRVACEFGTSGITSPGAGEFLPGVDLGALIAKAGKEVVFSDQIAHGFVRLTLTPAEAKADMVAVSTITSQTITTSTVKSFRVVPEGPGVSAMTEV
jgi:alkaline phosphatase D